MHELVNDPEMMITVHYVESQLQKGNVFTNSMTPQNFKAALQTIGMMQKLEDLQI